MDCMTTEYINKTSSVGLGDKQTVSELLMEQQVRQFAYNVTLRRVYVTIVVVGKI